MTKPNGHVYNEFSIGLKRDGIGPPLLHLFARYIAMVRWDISVLVPWETCEQWQTNSNSPFSRFPVCLYKTFV